MIWSLRFDGFDPADERHREALCTVGNGRFATRGAAPEARADAIHHPGTYAAGVFDRLTSTVGGRQLEHESAVNVPNWLPLRFRIGDGPWFAVEDVEVLRYEQVLDLRRGVLLRRIRFRDAAGRTTRLAQRRFASMADPHLAALETTIHAEDWSQPLTVRSGLDGTVENDGVARYRGLASRHLDDVACRAIDDETIALGARTAQSRIEVALAARTRVHRGGDPLEPGRRTIDGERRIDHELTLPLTAGEAVTIEKLVALHCSRDAGISEPALASRRALATAPGFEPLLRRHVLRWDGLWDRCRVEVDAPSTTAILNLHLFHLLQTVNENVIDLDAGVPARGLHGEAYRGHVFWDDVFVFPLLSLKMPELTRALLRYRHRRLPEARAAAAAAGFRGAMFPWQSGSDGREESQQWHRNPLTDRWLPDRSHRQRHIGIAIAYNVWRHFQATGDVEFLADEGAELLLEIARFWASIANYDHARDRYTIRGVMGPDEFHDGYPDRDEPGIDDNAYTNLMAVWVLARAREALDRLPRQRRNALREQLDLRRHELDRWRDIGRRMAVPFHDDGRIISQFAGYERLEELDWESYRRRYGDIARLDRILDAEGDSANRYKASKQADVLMLFYLLSAEELRELLTGLGYPFEHETIPRNVEYYGRRTADGSTLSRVVHAWVLARGDRPGSWPIFREALDCDLVRGPDSTTGEGIHLGAMAGTVDLVHRCYAGVELREDALWVDPRLPAELRELEFSVRYRGHWDVRIAIGNGRLRISVPPSDRSPIAIVHDGVRRTLGPGETLDLPLR
ncbi:glycoside hydrolase family 65 protein [Patulibacter defluvii]|uniref:glycoside hydrolase family 65 protein n=1 Tax=Patulibacter defluvii TaxID=3095358 RepID=UPI002A762978|nr:glycosyl hydrolase family 65 protein [Patulibacter sp. DM4]